MNRTPIKPPLIINQSRLLRSDLSGKWFIVTKWRDLGGGNIEAHTKYLAHEEDLERIRATA